MECRTVCVLYVSTVRFSLIRKPLYEKPFQCYGISYRIVGFQLIRKPVYEKPFQCYGMSYRVSAVSQYRTFPIHTKNALGQAISILLHVVPCTCCKSVPYVSHSYENWSMRSLFNVKACRTVYVLQVSTVRFPLTRKLL